MAANKCKLCLECKPLRNSHIIPEFLYQPLYHERHRTFVVERKERDRWIQKGFREYMLCTDCEIQISRYEKHAAEVLRSVAALFDGTKPGDLVSTQVDYTRFKLFQLSLLWRAGVSSHSFFRLVKLGPHENKLRRMLHEERPGEPEEYGCILITSPGPHKLARFMDNPRPQRLNGYNAYGFLLAGMTWFYIVSNHWASLPWPANLLSKSGSLPIAISPYTEHDIERFIQNAISTWKHDA